MSKATSEATSAWEIRTLEFGGMWQIIIFRDGREFYKSADADWFFSWTAKVAAKNIIRETVRRERREAPVIFMY